MKNKKIITLLTMCMLLILSACESSVLENTQSNQNLITDLGNVYNLKEEGKYSASTHPLILSVFVHYEDDYTLKDTLEISQEITEYTNIIINGVASQYSNDSKMEFSMLMQQPKLPDVIAGETQDILKYGVEEAFIPLEDLINEYAPNIKEVFDKYPEVRASVTNDEGNIYAIPFVDELEVSNQWWIRQDWLDAVGLAVPTTYTELEKVLVAFKTKDPNKNGTADEIPLFSNTQSGIYDYIPFFGVNPYFHLDEYGKIQNGAYTQEFKNAMKGISVWYQKGYIANNVFENLSELDFIANNTGGITYGDINYISSYNDIMANNFKMIAIAPPTDINGISWVATNTSLAGKYGWGISVDNSFPIETIKMMDFLFSQEGSTLMTYGILDKTYTIDANGQKNYINNIKEEDLKNMGAMIKSMAFVYDKNTNLQLMNEEANLAYNLYKENNYENIINIGLKTLCFSESESEIITNLYPKCEEYINQKIKDWTMDSSLIDKEYEEYMQNLEVLGINEVISAYQSAYNRFRANIA